MAHPGRNPGAFQRSARNGQTSNFIKKLRIHFTPLILLTFLTITFRGSQANGGSSQPPIRPSLAAVHPSGQPRRTESADGMPNVTVAIYPIRVA